MKRNWYLLAVLFVLSVTLYLPSCVHDPVYSIDDTINPSDTSRIDTMDADTTVTVDSCDTENVRFSVEIQTILESGCISCHNVAAPSAGIRLDSYDLVVQEAESGRLLGSIRWEPAYVNMPFGGAQLSDCAIEQMELWIADGMPNN